MTAKPFKSKPHAPNSPRKIVLASKAAAKRKAGKP